ncbi:hypothetical protein [Mycolicibacterium arenosum]|uniref:VOC domain-containing protein n=1 Tax=Mycolicibacterium arenosum TaxID=2952157 RepID=A0ABT1MCB2_9MYCO|nr:hypothetical protein [Mycolicibacterium sp. CAU 1645]MCP9276813.1 hypothetical protein [Mycolicibacterium sp. CAU 1645]
MYDLLCNAEVFVDDVAVAEKVFVDALGFPEPHAAWGNNEPGSGFTYLFARVHPSLLVSPTRIEAMAVASLDAERDPLTTLPFLPKLLAAQGDRPWKTHANEIATSDIRRLALRLRDTGCSFYEMPGIFTRLWIGWTEDDPGAYEPSVDGGLFFEFIETSALGKGDKLWEPRPDPDLPPGGMIRVLRRSWITEDLWATVQALEQNFGLMPAIGPVLDESLAARQVIYRFRHPRSAELQVLEPIAHGEIRDSLDTWGPGSWAIRIGVNDVEGKADDLTRRGTPFEVRSTGHGPELLRVDTGKWDVPGIFEFARV